MTKFSLLMSGALGALASALLLAGTPAVAQDRGDRGSRAERPTATQGASRSSHGWGDRRQQDRATRSDGGRRSSTDGRSGGRGEWSGRRDGRPAAAAAPSVPAASSAPSATRGTYGAGRAPAYTGQRDRSYGADRRGPDQQSRPATAWNRDGGWQRDGRDDARRGDWQRDRRDDARRGDWQRDRRDDDRRGDWQRDRRGDNRWSHDQRRWDNRGWRNDRRYDWYRYRAANRNVYRLGRYYAPYSNYRYSRISIGFRLGSPFYSNRYWINDPWQYRLPSAYGSYRWVRYYNDALLVDTYTGQVVDVIHDFFW